jgi:predicted NBD/HSP70 family sugar kinase
MAHFVGLDVSVKQTSVCVVDDAGKVVLEQKVPTEPADIIALLTSLGVGMIVDSRAWARTARSRRWSTTTAAGVLTGPMT